MAVLRHILVCVVTVTAVLVAALSALSLFKLAAPSNNPDYVDHQPSNWLTAVSERMGETVALFPENTRHYAMGTLLGEKEWRALYPLENGVVEFKLGSSESSQQRFTVAMFHQLQCLDIIREELVAPVNGSESSSTRIMQWDESRRWALTNHCMNYLRQMLLCQSNLALESVRSDNPPAIVDLTRSRYTCKDWTVLYDQELYSSKY